MDALDVTVPGRDAGEVSEHVRLLEEGGYLEAVRRRRGEQLHWFPARLTWAGYELLESMQSRPNFDRAKQMAAKALGSVSLEAVKLALAVIRDEAARIIR
jgi:hypothetical protein